MDNVQQKYNFKSSLMLMGLILVLLIGFISLIPVIFSRVVICSIIIFMILKTKMLKYYLLVITVAIYFFYLALQM